MVVGKAVGGKETNVVANLFCLSVGKSAKAFTFFTYITCCGGEANVLMHPNVERMVSAFLCPSL